MTGKIMGLDYGSKTVGVAVSDDLLLFSQPKETIRRDRENKLRKTLSRIHQLAEDHHVDAIVIGLPLLPDGSEGERAQKVRAFADLVKESTNLPVTLLDERYTTAVSDEELEEMNVRKADRKKVIDQLAACHILDEYLHTVKEKSEKKA